MSYLSVDRSGRLVIECSRKSGEMVRESGAHWDQVICRWVIAFTPENLELMLDRLPDPELDPSVEEAYEKYEERIKRLAQIRAMSKVDYPVRLKVPGLIGPASLYNYQKLGVMFALANGQGVLIADEMGLGKTLQGISSALILKNRGEANNALIISPPSLKYNWAKEVEKWTTEKFVVIDGGPDERVAQWRREDVFFYIVNFELLLEDLFGGKTYKKKKDETEDEKRAREEKIARSQARKRILSPVSDRLWDLIIVDEAHALKSNSKRSSNVKKMRGRFKMALTGTPLDGKLEELYNVMEFVCPGILGNRTKFMQRHAETDYWGKVTGYRRVGEVRKKISPYFIRRLKKDVLKDLPGKLYSNRIVTLSAAEMSIYKSLASRGHQATKDSTAMTAVVRCKQFCDSPEILADALEDSEIDRKTIQKIRKTKSSKLEMMREILDEIIIENGHKVIVFSQYAEMVKVLRRLFEEMGLSYLCIWGETDKKDRSEYQDRFNNDKSIDIMIGTEAMSTGLNFTSADYVINYDDNWAPTFMAQREDRAHRIGQKNVVTVINFICRDTIEERIRSLLYSKSKISAQALGDDVDDFVLRRLGPKEAARLL